ncbi:T9SS type A sorting domain-containing protein [Cryomorpha ignava]|uniref:T9SS type A sorting domain-containing protein n=1 Tax=Cryomorpha ignava TaxID=101383 RepID=A0A7K3WJR7_9FLAO|nr:T9SS type A sorting domain-containing protein [Cryomorpha ignava]NEN21887.1 T9SS type A sorting domain-containing protein [Cryomorpha ignava]
MKKALLLFMAASLSIGTMKAQIANGTVLEENVIITDLDGNVHDIFAYLDSGKTVVLDLYAEWCGPCWNYHNDDLGHPAGGALKDLYYTYGDGVDGTNEVIVIGIESDASTPVSAIGGGAGSTYGWNWLSEVPYPMANDNSVAGIFEQAYYPYIIRICPNRQIFELGQQNAENIMTDVGGCVTGGGEINPAVLSYNGTVATCDDVEVEVTIQNVGSANLTAVTLDASNTDGSLLTYEWTGDLAPFETADVTLGTTTISETSDITVTITSADEDSDFSSVTQNVAMAVETTNVINVHLELDTYGSETTWKIRNSDNVQVASGGPYGAQSLQTLDIQVIVDASECYSFSIYDSFGDGLNGASWTNGTDGFYTVTSSDGTVVVSGGGAAQFSVETSPFETTSDASAIEDVLVNNSFNLFPNPASSNLSIELDLLSSERVTVDVFDIVGKNVHSVDFGKMSAGYSLHTLKVNELNDGVYMMNVKIGENNIASKFVVRH